MSISYLRHSTLKIVSCLLLFGILPNLYSQTSYKITYQISEIKFHGSIDDLDESAKKFTKQIADRAKEINYILITNNDASYFELEAALGIGNDSPLDKILFSSAKRFPSFNENVYANHKENYLVFVKNLVSRDFMVKRSPYNFNWIIKEDSKKILGFDAKKAEGNYHDPVTNKDLNVEAWFIPSIPLQSGPDIFMGLPGLIAEVHVKGAVVTMKKMEPNKNMEIKKVDTSKAMSQQEYEEIVENLTQRFKDIIDD